MKNKNEAMSFLKKFDSNYKHCSNIKTKLKKEENEKKIQFLIECINKYKIYDENFNVKDFDNITKTWNEYLYYVRDNNKYYSSQSKFESTILEESIFRMFMHIEKDNIKIGGTKAYSNMYFAPNNFDNFKNDTVFKFNTKEQDFAIYKKIEVNIDNKKENISIPIIAMECKTYLDKTMLEGSIATAEKIKNGNPYCKFYIITESYEVDLNVDIKSTRIDQIYILTKSSKRHTNKYIQKDVLELLYNDINRYLKSNWYDIEKNIFEKGTIL